MAELRRKVYHYATYDSTTLLMPMALALSGSKAVSADTKRLRAPHLMYKHIPLVQPI